MILQLLLALFGMAAQVPPDAHSVTLSWTDTRNPAGTTYNVWRTPGLCSGGNLTFAKIAAAVPAKSYVDSPIAPGNYCYQVTAVAGGMESAPSNTAAAPVPSFSPTGLSGVTQ